jgi:hypothetical protein
MLSGSQTLWVDGSVAVSQSITTDYDTGFPMYLFALNVAGVAADITSSRCYSCKIYDNGILVRDFVPCKNTAGEVGLFDLVGNKFYGNNGAGNFIAGDNIGRLPLYNRWIQTSSPNNTSVTGFKPINTSWPMHNAGIRKYPYSCAYTCDGSGNWFAPIGQYSAWNNAIPAADETPQTETELWIRTDNLPSASALSIFDKSITAKDYIEI